MNLIKITKQTGAKRLHRAYTIENGDGFTVPFESKIFGDTIEFESKFEAEFLEIVNDFREVQRVAEAKKAREKNVPKVLEITEEQGTKEWLASRIGIITASDVPFDTKGLKTPKIDEYIDRKLAEKFILTKKGVIGENNFISDAMGRGLELEHLAIEKYERETGNIVTKKGLIKSIDNMIGASPDGMTVDEEFNAINIEIKSVLLKHYIGQLDRDIQTHKYKSQMQVQMYILDTDVTHFIVQCQEDESLPIILREVHRDEEYICNLIDTLHYFEKEFKRRSKKLLEFCGEQNNLHK